jgi:hypothetical protein
MIGSEQPKRRGIWKYSLKRETDSRKRGRQWENAGAIISQSWGLI